MAGKSLIVFKFQSTDIPPLTSGMPLTLFYDDRSPPVRSVLLLIEALDLPVELRFIDLFACQHLSPEFLKVNPLHRVPALKDEEVTLTDSHSILLYLADKFGGREFGIQSSVERAKIVDRLMFNATLFFQRDSAIMRGIFRTHSRKVNPDDVVGIKEMYQVLDSYLGDSAFVSGDSISIADLAIVSTLSTIEMVIPVDEEYSNVKRWYETMRNLPYYGRGNQIGLDKLKAVFDQLPED